MMAESSQKLSAHVDRGWAWVVCIAGHFCTALTVGYSTSLGVFFIEWKEQFNLSATSSSWVVGLPLMVAGSGTLFMGAIALRLGIRRVSMLGSAVSGLATILGSFSTDVSHLYLSAAMSGTGFMMVVSPALVILSHYFRKKFALANGLFIVGISTGQTVFPPLFRLLINTYGWRGAMLVGGAIQMNSVVACALFRTLKTSSDKVRHGGGRLEGLDNEGAIDMDIETTVSGTLPNITKETQTPDQTRKPMSTENEQPNASLKNNRCEVKISDRKLQTEGLTENIPIEAIVSDQRLDSKHHMQESVKKQQKGFVSPPNEEPSQGQVSCQDININSVGRGTATTSNQRCPQENRERRKLRDHFGLFDVFSNFQVILIIVESCLVAIGLSTNLVHLPARVKEAGWSEDQGALVLSIYAIVSVVTRATHGWFVDRNYIDAFKLQSIALLGCAVVTFMNPVSDNYIYLIGYGILLGGFSGIAAPLLLFTAKTVARPSQVPSAMSLILAGLFLFIGTGPVIAGKMYDATGNYVAPFFAAGAVLLAAFILNVIVAVCKRIGQSE